jgi:hypothetical protein
MHKANSSLRGRMREVYLNLVSQFSRLRGFERENYAKHLKQHFRYFFGRIGLARFEILLFHSVSATCS